MKPETSINYKKIVDDVLEKISRGELQKGDKLPTELCLATKFEVSRTCVREAIKSLEAFEKAADGKATKIIIPSEIQSIAGLVKSVTEIGADDKKEEK